MNGSPLSLAQIHIKHNNLCKPILGLDKELLSRFLGFWFFFASLR